MNNLRVLLLWVGIAAWLSLSVFIAHDVGHLVAFAGIYVLLGGILSALVWRP